MEQDENIFIGRRHEWGGDSPFGIDVPPRRQHIYVLGQTGSGKSTLLYNMIVQDIEAGRGVAVIDPHGQLAADVLEMIPPSRTNQVIYFDPSSRRPIALNLFKAVGNNWHVVASGIVSAFKKIWGHSWGPRLEYVLYASLAALLQCQNTSLLGVSRMLYDDKYRAWVVKQVKDPMVRAFWLSEFENYDRSYRQELAGPIQNKVGQLFFSPALRNVLGQVKSKINFRHLMDRKGIFIANLSKDALGEAHSNLLGSLLVTAFELAALSRANIPEKERADFFLFSDEFQNYATESFAGILSEARKYRLCLTIAHQYMSQLDEKITNAVFGNVGTFLIFRPGEADASVLERQFGNSLTRAQFTGLENYELCVKLLNKEPFFARSLPPLKLPRQRRRAVMRQSRQRFGKKRKRVEEKIEKWLGKKPR